MQKDFWGKDERKWRQTMVNKLSESKCTDCCLLPLRLLLKMPHCTGFLLTHPESTICSSPLFSSFFWANFLPMTNVLSTSSHGGNIFFQPLMWKFFSGFGNLNRLVRLFFFFSFAKPGTHSFSDRILSGCLVIPLFVHAWT